jgi:hypothetical protein
MYCLERDFEGFTTDDEPTPVYDPRIGPFREPPPEFHRPPPQRRPTDAPTHSDGTPIEPGNPRAPGSLSREASRNRRFVYDSVNTVHTRGRITEQVSNRTLNRLPYDVRPSQIPITVQRFDELLDGSLKSLTRSNDLDDMDRRLADAESLAKLVISGDKVSQSNGVHIIIPN